MIEKCLKDFPLLSRKIQGRRITYLDSAATTLKPWPVIERVSQFLSFETANVHRGSYRLSNQVTENFERVRERLRSFIGASYASEIIFTRGTTESINLVSFCLENAPFLESNDAILVTQMEHHSNFVPWQRLAKKKGCRFLVWPLNNQGVLDLDDLSKILKNHPVKLVSFSALSNVLGWGPSVTDTIALIKGFNPSTLVMVDAAQAVTFMSINVTQWNCDFLAFSGHKIFGPYGIGVLYMKSHLQSQLPPFQSGGGMVDRVTLEDTTYLDGPYRFEAGTPNIEGVLGLGASIDYFSQFSINDVVKHEQNLMTLIRQELSRIDGIRVLSNNTMGNILSISFNKAHPLDVAQLLSENNVFVRAGHHCCQPLMQRFGVTSSLRVSLSIYNQPDDVTRFINALHESEQILGGF
ncbi:MAG: aminotransferase class V-fold PLP-dependent enzyme [Bdellovibrionaceae bacterium]|nr:aminotransferase class V-fold PLP-dependent enzyme [Pseudobdellovibrionaceae bacterium]MDW8191097.1 aminotransferase class V-fold PLP-dependent enzyme [Pseudobdellovibrionaceae bacterium]